MTGGRTPDSLPSGANATFQTLAAQLHMWECREGRQLIYELSAKHRNCLLLNYAIQRILHAGHENEVASVGPSLASYFGVFHRLMANRLKEVAQADADRVDSLAAELKVRAYAMLVLSTDTPGSRAFLGWSP